MKKHFFNIFILLITQIYSQKTFQDKDTQTIKIPPITFGKTKLNLSTVIDSSFTVRLETKKGNIIGSINKLIIYKNHIFVLDSYSSKGLFEFTMQGKFIRKYGEEGRGPGEYSSLSTFIINKITEEISLFDGRQRRILVYNLQGEFIKSNKTALFINELAITNSGYIADTHNSNYRNNGNTELDFSIMKLDMEGNIIFKFLKGIPKIGNLVSPKSLMYSEYGLLYHAPFSNVIYKIEEDKVAPLFKIDFEDQEVPKGIIKKNTPYSKLKNEILTKKYAYMGRGCYSIINNVLIFPVMKGKNNQTCLYSLKTNKIYQGVNRINNDTDSFGFRGITIGFHEKFIINYSQPDWLISGIKYPDSKNIKKFLKETNIDDNPILIFNRIKDNI